MSKAAVMINLVEPHAESVELLMVVETEATMVVLLSNIPDNGMLKAFLNHSLSEYCRTRKRSV